MKSPDPPPRPVRFREGQPLTAVDLNAEEGALVAYRTAHNLSHHTWGIVTGLQLEIATVGGLPTLTLAPGSAVDGFGRELYVTEHVTVPGSSLTAFFSGATKGFDVWLVYRLGKGTSAGRVGEQTIVRVTTPVSDPGAAAPPSGGADWPVYLGSVSETAEVVMTGIRYVGLRGEQLVSSSGAPAGATRIRVGMADDGSGSAVSFGVTAGDAFVSNGQQTPTLNAFLNGVNIGGPAAQPSSLLTHSAGASAPAPALRKLIISKALSLQLMLSETNLCGLPSSGQNLLVIGEVNDVLHFVVFDANGKKIVDVDETALGSKAALITTLKTTLRGLSSATDPTPDERHKVIAESLAIVESTLPFTSLAFDPFTTPPANPVNWRIYRIVVPDPDPKNPPTDQLRFEFFNPGSQGDPARSTFVLRLSDATNNLKYNVLTATADGNVTIGDPNNQPNTRAGDLNVIGQLVESPVTINPSDPRFIGQLSSQLLSGAVSSRVIPVLQVTVTAHAGTLIKPDNPAAVFDVAITTLSSSPGPVTGIQVYGNATIPLSDSSTPTVAPITYDPVGGTLTLAIPADAKVGSVLTVNVIAIGSVGTVLIAVGQPGPFPFTITS